MFDQVHTLWTEGTPSSPYQGLSAGDTVPTTSDHPWRGNSNDFFKLSDIDGLIRNYRAQIGPNRWNNYHDAILSTPRAVPDPSDGTMRRMYMSWDLNLSFVSNSQSGSHKFIRVWDTIGGSEEEIRISWTQMHLTYQGGSSSWGSVSTTPNQWHRMELFIDVDAGQIKAWFDGRKIHDITNFSVTTTRGLQPRLLGWDASGDADFRDEIVQLSNIYIDNTLARVEICDAALWTDCQSRAVQIPTQWKENEIQAQLAFGNFDNTERMYLYVVDHDGNVNREGVPLCSRCPTPPKIN
ncbi:polysaccharide lyase [Natronocella acetinitrilica]|nr:polysaccharide lyase [Natronocella acetinitrilica]